MPMLCLAGTYAVVGTEPDGDSIRFVPTNPPDWAKVGGRHRVRVNAHGGAQLRLDGIDALETHYAPRGGHRLHQPLGFARAAGSELLEWLGFEEVVCDEEKVTSVATDHVPGFLLTRSADVHGRCVVLIGRGDPPSESGKDTHVDIALLRTSANHHLISAGLAYPTFYAQLYVDLRREIAERAAAAREGSDGLYVEDATADGAEVVALQTLTDDAVLLPKLFRRLVDYLHLNGDDPSLAGFPAFLSQRDDRLYIISAGQKTGFDTVVEVENQVVRLTHPPEDLLFDEQ